MAARIQKTAANITAAVSGSVFAGAITPWLYMDYYTALATSLLVSQDNGGGNTLAIDYVLDDIQSYRGVYLSQATTVITVTDYGPQLRDGPGLGHGLAVGDLYILAGTQSAGLDGTYTVASVTSATVLTLTAAVSQTVTGPLQCQAKSGMAITAGATGESIIGAGGATLTTRATVKVASPLVAARLRCTTFSAAAIARLTAVMIGLQA